MFLNFFKNAVKNFNWAIKNIKYIRQSLKILNQYDKFSIFLKFEKFNVLSKEFKF